MLHERLAVSEICTLSWPLTDELALWDELGIRRIGVLVAKLDAAGRDDAVAALRRGSLTATTVITGNFDLSTPATWDETRASVDDAIALASHIGGCVYLTPGRRDGRSFDELTRAFAEAIAPCVTTADGHGVRLAIEPSQRTDQSFVHTLHDAIDVADAAGVGIVADIGNCWTEREVELVVRRAGARIAMVQLSDARFGTVDQPASGGRLVPGDGDLAVRDFVAAALEAGYEGAFEIEQLGPVIAAEGEAPALRRAVEWVDAVLTDLLG